MAGLLGRLIGFARLNTSDGLTISIRSQSGVFDSNSWTRNAAGDYTCTLSDQNEIDPTAIILVTPEETDILKIVAPRVNRVSPSLFHVRFFNNEEPDIGFSIGVFGVL